MYGDSRVKFLLAVWMIIFYCFRSCKRISKVGLDFSGACVVGAQGKGFPPLLFFNYLKYFCSCYIFY